MRLSSHLDEGVGGPGRRGNEGIPKWLRDGSLAPWELPLAPVCCQSLGKRLEGRSKCGRSHAVSYLATSSQTGDRSTEQSAIIPKQEKRTVGSQLRGLR